MQDGEEILDIVHLTPDDLAKNQEKRLSPAQVRFLKKKQLLWGIGTLTLFLLSVALITTLAIKSTRPDFAGHGELIFAVPVMLIWLWLLRESPVRWRQTYQDIQADAVARVEGQVQCETVGNIGLVQIPHFMVHIAEFRFSVDRQIYFQFKNREHYRVFYAPQSRILLGGVQTRSISQKTRNRENKTKELIEHLTPQEQELLHQIALGHSNKEIAFNLSLSPNTIKMYTSKLYRKLGVRRRTEAVARARELKLL
jgi:DNA-binding CsgD family transcriptional regulator